MLRFFLYTISMARKAYPIFLLLIIWVIAILNFYAYRFHWYWEFRWLDIIMHTLGGVWAASASLWLYYFRNTTEELFAVPKKSSVLFVAFLSFLFVGVGWELFEFGMDKFITFAPGDIWNTREISFLTGWGVLLLYFFFLGV